jgi:hypothetical protein
MVFRNQRRRRKGNSWKWGRKLYGQMRKLSPIYSLNLFLEFAYTFQPRNLLTNTIENKCPSFTNMSTMNKLDYILNPTSDLL